jgi:hypothetical protein
VRRQPTQQPEQKKQKSELMPLNVQNICHFEPFLALEMVKITLAVEVEVEDRVRRYFFLVQTISTLRVFELCSLGRLHPKQSRRARAFTKTYFLVHHWSVGPKSTNKM